jgi:hypothetical protein
MITHKANEPTPSPWTTDARTRRDERALQAALSQPRAAPVHRSAHRGVDQIRRQRLPCHQYHLHQQNRRRWQTRFRNFAKIPKLMTRSECLRVAFKRSASTCRLVRPEVITHMPIEIARGEIAGIRLTSVETERHHIRRFNYCTVLK